ncbi:hypothetical protein AM500_18340 [Bacillus sp. FJAT-18017]|uniref:hypothetical protein n=1 Tax=Bacillus sp. FJAT-18017 TaxID=1705566 RepID=UPI0006AD96BE|nr:hypothetical protein [Bacillus sp. FJAT-18017]ALC91524.1 hypothetical protein AM500_18340 [Bacillus sp. FJAT-18017]
MEFKEYLEQKHILIKGERKLKEIYVKKYINRLGNMCREGIYNEEKHVDEILEQKVHQKYRDWKTYLKTIEHYQSSKNLTPIDYTSEW